MTDDLVKRLRDNVADILDWNGKVMTAWDTVRAMIAKGDKGSLPRDIMESYLSGYAEDINEAADRIEKLEAALRDCIEMAEVHEIPFRNRVMYISDIARKALEGKDE